MTYYGAGSQQNTPREQQGFPPRVTVEFGFGGIRNSWITDEDDEGEDKIDGIHDGQAKDFLSEAEHTALLAEAVREQRLQTMKDIVKLLHLTNGKEHGIRCVEDCISALEAASTDGGKGGE